MISTSRFSLLVYLGLGTTAGAQGIKLNEPLAHPIGGDVEESLLTPDGTRAVYVADQLRDGVRELFSAPTDGSQAWVRLSPDLAPGAEVVGFNLRLSADGVRVLFQVGDGFGQAELWSVASDGNTPAVLLSATALSFAFTPDGGQVLLTSDILTPGVIELFRVPSDGSAGPVRLSGRPLGGGDVRSFLDEPCAFSADGTRVVYVADHTVFARQELYSVPLDGSLPAMRLNGAFAAGGQVQGTGGFAPMLISPDGARVVFRADKDVNDRFELYSVPSDGSSAAVKISGSTIAQGDVQGGTFAPSFADVPDFRITPDGTRVVFRADRVADGVFALFVAPIDGSSPPVALTPAGAGSRSALEYDVSPDSTRVVFVADLRATQVFELFVVPLDGSRPPARLSSPLVVGGDVSGGFGPSFLISNDSRWVVYRADQELDQEFELFRVPLGGRRFVRRSDRSPPPFVARKLSPPIVAGPSVGAFELEPSGTCVILEANRALYAAALASAGPAQRLDSTERAVVSGTFALAANAPRLIYRGQEATNVNELFAAPFDASAPPAKVNGPLPLGPVTGDVVDFAFDAAGDRVVYLADGDTDEVLELYSTRTTGRAPVRKLNQALFAGGVGFFRIHPGGDEVLYLALQSGHGAPAPYAVPIGGGPARLLGGPFPSGSFVEELDLTADGSRIVFTANPDVFTLAGLYSAPFDGGAPRVDLSSVSGQPRFVNRFYISPLSDRVAFVTIDSGVERTLHSVPIDRGSDPLALSTAAQGIVTQVAFTPDGQHIVYGVQQGIFSSLYGVPADGSQPAVSLGGPTLNGAVLEFALAPDSSRVVWLENVSTFRDLWSAPVDGSTARVRIATQDLFGGGSLYSPRITPDSTRIVFLSGLPPGMKIAPIDGSAAPSTLSGAGNWAVAFDLDPAGTVAAYWGDAPGLGRGVLRVALDGSGPIVRLSPEFEPFTYGEIRFVPDGGQVLFTADVGSSASAGPYVVGLDGATCARLVTRLPAAGHLSSALDGPRFQVSADSSKVVYRALLNDSTQVNELFLSLLERAPLPSDPP